MRGAQMLYRKARALSLMGDYAGAEDLLSEAEAADAGLKADAARERAAIRQRRRAAEEKQRKGLAGFLKK
jgi:hypothetical protein